jgi:hypothetical protein
MKKRKFDEGGDSGGSDNGNGGHYSASRSGGDGDSSGSEGASAPSAPSYGGYTTGSTGNATDASGIAAAQAAYASPAASAPSYAGYTTGSTENARSYGDVMNAQAADNAPGGSSFFRSADGRVYGNIQDAAAAMGKKPSEISMMGAPQLPGLLGSIQSGIGWLQDRGLPGYAMTPEERAQRNESQTGGGHGGSGAAPFRDAPAQTTDTKKVEDTASIGDGVPIYQWDPVLGRYTLTHAGTGSAALGRKQGDTTYAEGGEVSGLHAATHLPSRMVRGAGDGQSDDIPVKMDDGGDGRLADNEFVVAADAVSILGNGSSEAGARALYEMVDRIRQAGHGKTEQQKPVDPAKVLPA